MDKTRVYEITSLKRMLDWVAIGMMKIEDGSQPEISLPSASHMQRDHPSAGAFNVREFHGGSTNLYVVRYVIAHDPAWVRTYIPL